MPDTMTFATRLAVIALVGSLAPPLAPAQPDSTPRLVGRVRHVVDGDTLEVVLASGPIEVRFANIDAPEHDQPGGEAAARALAGHLGRNAAISLEPVKQDDYGRIVATAHLGTENLEQWMLQQGHAWTYRRYARDAHFCRWEDEAREARRGLWARPLQQRIAPWDWRHRRQDIEAGTYRPTESSLEQCLSELRRPKQ